MALGSDAWNDRFAELKEYQKTYGNSDVPQGHSKNPALARWVKTQRVLDRRGTLAKDRARRLGRIKFLFGKYREEHGHCKVTRGNFGNASLAEWVHDQRKLAQRGALVEDRIKRLEDIGFSFRKGLDARWDNHFKELEAFTQTHRHCNVPWSHALKVWVNSQQLFHRRGKLAEDRFKRLQEIGVSFEKNHGVRCDDQFKPAFQTSESGFRRSSRSKNASSKKDCSKEEAKLPPKKLDAASPAVEGPRSGSRRSLRSTATVKVPAKETKLSAKKTKSPEKERAKGVELTAKKNVAEKHSNHSRSRRFLRSSEIFEVSVETGPRPQQTMLTKGKELKHAEKKNNSSEEEPEKDNPPAKRMRWSAAEKILGGAEKCGVWNSKRRRFASSPQKDDEGGHSYKRASRKSNVPSTHSERAATRPQQQIGQIDSCGWNEGGNNKLE